VVEPVEDLGSKPEWRQRLLAARRSLSVTERAELAKSLVNRVRAVPGATVCAFVPVGAEPGSVELLDALVADGRRVLLPVVSGAGPLDWARYRGRESLVAGPHGLREPAGPRAGPAAIGSADLVLVPALAVDHRGVRLGRGGGHYDRSLPLATPGAALVAVVRDDEVVPVLPAEPHDVPMTAVLTPGVGLRGLPM
jgi:5-formyltetrahydrofolate cyclo-ligase